MESRRYVRYSEAFKRQVVSELESGKFIGPHAAARAYGIKGALTVGRWLRRDGRSDLLGRGITVTTAEEKDEKKALKERVGELERTLADADMEGALEESYLRCA